MTIQMELKNWFPASFLLFRPIVLLFLKNNCLSSQINSKIFLWVVELKSRFLDTIGVCVLSAGGGHVAEK